MLAAACHIWPLLCWGTFLLYQFAESFDHERMLHFVKWFFCIYWYAHMIFSFILLMWCIIHIDLHMPNHPCIPRMTPTCPWCMILLMYYLIHFASILLRVYVCQEYWPIVFFSYSVLTWLLCQDNAGLVKWVSECTLLFNFFEECEENWH